MIHIYVNILAQGGDRSYFYQIFMGRKQPIPLQDSELFTKLRRKLLEIVWTALWCCDLVIWCFTVDILVSLNYVMTVFGANLFRLFVIENFKVSAICKKLWRVRLLYQYLCCSMLCNSSMYILSKWSIAWSKNEYYI